MLEDLFVRRYGVSEGAAHWFMAVNLVGAALALPLLGRLRARWPAARLLAGAALADATLLLLLALPWGYGPSLLVRAVEGGADMIVLALLFDWVGRTGRTNARGRRFGIAGTTLLAGLAVGSLLGGVVGGIRATAVFWTGGASLALVALLAHAARARITDAMEEPPAAPGRAPRASAASVWPMMAMTFSDRAVGGVMATTVPLFLRAGAGLEPRSVGALLAIPLGLMALLGFPAGALGDRWGALPLRLAAAAGYAGAFATLAFVAGGGPAGMFPPMILLGLAGAALLPTVLDLAHRSGAGATGLGACQAAGNAGFLLGIVAAGLLVDSLAPSASGVPPYARVIVGFAAGHACVTAVTSWALRARLREFRSREAPAHAPEG